MSEDLERALDRLARDESPTAESAHLGDDELRMVRIAQLIRGSTPAPPRPQFVAELRGNLRPGIRVSRRTAFLSGFGALAAGILGGIGLDHLRPASTPSQEAIVPTHGKWHVIARVDELPTHAVQRFSAGAVEGFVIKHGSQVHAISSFCTHLACRLNYEQSEGALVCPCHGAEFSLNGQTRYGPYGHPLPPLPKIPVRVRDGQIEVLGA